MIAAFVRACVRTYVRTRILPCKLDTQLPLLLMHTHIRMHARAHAPSESPAELLMDLLAELLAGQAPDLRQVVVLRSLLLRNADWYRPLGMGGQLLRNANLEVGEGGGRYGGCCCALACVQPPTGETAQTIMHPPGSD